MENLSVEEEARAGVLSSRTEDETVCISLLGKRSDHFCCPHQAIIDSYLRFECTAVVALVTKPHPSVNRTSRVDSIDKRICSRASSEVPVRAVGPPRRTVGPLRRKLHHQHNEKMKDAAVTSI